MIRQQQTFMLSPYAELYNLVVPKDNMLRQINELGDFTVANTIRHLQGRPPLAFLQELDELEQS